MTNPKSSPYRADPYFPFFASDYLSSSKVQQMTLEEEGSYIRLLCFDWQDGSIPNNVTKLARMCKTSPRRFRAIWDTLRQCFDELPDNPERLTNPRLEHIRQEREEYKQEQSQKGQRGNQKRWGNRSQADRQTVASESQEPRKYVAESSPEDRNGDAAGIAEASPQHRFPSPSPSPSLKSIPVHDSNTLNRPFPTSERAGDLEPKNQSEHSNGNGAGKLAKTQEAWGLVEAHIRKQVTDDSFLKFYSGIRVALVDSRKIVLAVPDPLIDERNAGDLEITATVLRVAIEKANRQFMRDRGLLVCRLSEFNQFGPLNAEEATR